jgi:hypothetical protein
VLRSSWLRGSANVHVQRSAPDTILARTGGRFVDWLWQFLWHVLCLFGLRLKGIMSASVIEGALCGLFILGKVTVVGHRILKPIGLSASRARECVILLPSLRFFVF